MLEKRADPLLIDVEQVAPTVQEGVGGARNLMKLANAMVSLLMDWD